jgi:two-component system sensor histidine kinase CpxA
MVQAVIAREGGGGRTTAIVAPELHVTAEPDLLARALSNLVRNALRYSGATEAVVVSARREGDRVVIAVDDSGPGVPPEAIDRLGEPFFRPEAARTRELGGVGLGLSIVRSAMVSCGGEVHFSNRTPHGFRAEIILAAA